MPPRWSESRLRERARAFRDIIVPVRGSVTRLGVLAGRPSLPVDYSKGIHLCLPPNSGRIILVDFEFSHKPVHHMQKDVDLNTVHVRIVRLHRNPISHWGGCAQAGCQLQASVGIERARGYPLELTGQLFGTLEMFAEQSLKDGQLIRRE